MRGETRPVRDEDLEAHAPDPQFVITLELMDAPNARLEARLLRQHQTSLSKELLGNMHLSCASAESFLVTPWLSALRTP